MSGGAWVLFALGVIWLTAFIVTALSDWLDYRRRKSQGY